jgi:1,4-dihydroxy-2-naphthoate octaprenyltransferase
MNTKTVLIILNIAALIGALIWLMIERSWEPLVTALGLVASLIALLYNSDNNQSGTVMKQRGGKGSTNYQSSGDININSPK